MTNQLIQIVSRFLQSYGYGSIKEFSLSLCPSFKYNLQMPTSIISITLALASKYLGIGPVIVFAMFVAVVVETVSGIYASKKTGIDFESFRFSRCVIKVSIWMVLIFIANSFSLECASRDGWIDRLGEVFFDIVRLFVLIYFAIEYIVSILENLAVIDGKPKTTFIESLQSLTGTIVELLKSKLSNK